MLKILLITITIVYLNCFTEYLFKPYDKYAKNRILTLFQTGFHLTISQYIRIRVPTFYQYQKYYSFDQKYFFSLKMKMRKKKREELKLCIFLSIYLYLIFSLPQTYYICLLDEYLLKQVLESRDDLSRFFSIVFKRSQTGILIRYSKTVLNRF